MPPLFDINNFNLILRNTSEVANFLNYIKEWKLIVEDIILPKIEIQGWDL
jgi:hypothetical protein